MIRHPEKKGAYGYEKNKGRTVVLHDSAGTRIACAVLNGIGCSKQHVGCMRTYPGYEPAENAAGVSGSVAIKTVGDGSLTLEWNLHNLESRVSGGIHVHTGKSCANAEDVGGHLFTSKPDPWIPTKYKSDNK